MSDDNPRGNESPDRQDASSETDHATRLFRERLETIDHLTNILLEETTRPTALEHLESAEQRAVRRRLREISAETNRTLCLVVGPEATIPEPDNDPRGERDE
ncbi:hypothetical protein [Halostagnicola sp. A-GB9-2]|uniref:hypothetical protein n=1 Tax=Halostagnicola sp. A-GB9-2 TaxID=3048066 RepID=UPI0024C029AA|nr:hypothetical protein [Halostagnicola sp. A-GB9-2]MDJ1431973.1 hypothetical protein [Halostagnicola sp. A-GB9-2]